MSLPANEKAKAQKIVKKIESGAFDDNDIDTLFMKLRAFSHGLNVFREIADFVAHNVARDRGVTNRSLDAFSLSMRYFSEYVSPGVSLDISAPFPLYVKRLMKYQIDRCNEQELRARFKVTRATLRSRIDSLFKEDKKSKTAQLHKRIGKETLDAISYVLGFIHSCAAFTQDELLNEMVFVLEKNTLIFDEQRLRAQGNRIAVCVLTLLHNTEFDLKGDQLGYCRIGSEKTAIPHNLRLVDENGDEVTWKEEFGNLQVNGEVVVQYNGAEVTVLYPVFTTNLGVEEWCDESLFSIEPVEAGDTQVLYRKVDFEAELGVSERFQLIPLSA
jgi:hypothetical protein